MRDELIEVVETSVFRQRAEKRLTENELDQLIMMLAARPAAGTLIKGGAGLRKVRLAAGGRGKSGGARVIYYFHDRFFPVFLLDVYGKGEKEDLSRKEIQSLAKLARLLEAEARSRSAKEDKGENG